MTMTERAYEAIREMIISGKTPPAAAIDIPQLSSQLGVGKTPVREALQRLAHEKLVVISPRRGTFASDIGILQLQQAYDARMLLERNVARIAATAMSREQIAQLADLWKDADVLIGQGDYATLLSIDEKFHRLVAKASRNEYLVEFLSVLIQITMRYWHAVLREAEDPRKTLRDTYERHLAIIAALASRDPNVAERAMVEQFRFRDRAIQAQPLDLD